MLGDFFPQTIDINSADAEYMRMALAEARTAMGRVAPNPPVGAVIVREGTVVGFGATQPPPGDHAEIVALRDAGVLAAGATLYVTLEPCSIHGRTPPCTDAIIDSGIQRVVVGTADPNPEIHRQGIARLRDAGIAVKTGVLEDEAARAVAGFRTRLETGRPHVLVKYAMTLDGKIATRTGHSRWIAGPEARELTHIMRDRIDAIMVGSNTVVVDNPQLTTRLPDGRTGYGGAHHPRRIVVDGRLRTPPDANILQPGFGDSPIIYCTDRAPIDAERRLTDAGALVCRTPAIEGHVDLRLVFEDLGNREINQVLLEGGGGLIGASFDSGLIDDVITFIAPVIVGGDGPPPVAGAGVETMPDAWKLANIRTHMAGDNIMLHGRVARPERTGDV